MLHSQSLPVSYHLFMLLCTRAARWECEMPRRELDAWPRAEPKQGRDHERPSILVEVAAAACRRSERALVCAKRKDSGRRGGAVLTVLVHTSNTETSSYIWAKDETMELAEGHLLIDGPRSSEMYHPAEASSFARDAVVGRRSGAASGVRGAVKRSPLLDAPGRRCLHGPVSPGTVRFNL